MEFGLAICRRVVEAHNGKITAESQLNMVQWLRLSCPKKWNGFLELAVIGAMSDNLQEERRRNSRFLPLTNLSIKRVALKSHFF